MVPGGVCRNPVCVWTGPCHHMIVCERHQNTLTTHFIPPVCPMHGCGQNFDGNTGIITSGLWLKSTLKISKDIF